VPFSLPSICSLQITHQRERCCLSLNSTGNSFGISVNSRCFSWCRRFRCAAAGVLLHRWKLGFNQCRLHLAYRTCGASSYTSSDLSAFPTCCFPLCLSTPGRLDVLRGSFALYLLLLGSYPESAETAHLSNSTSHQDRPLLATCLQQSGSRARGLVTGRKKWSAIVNTPEHLSCFVLIVLRSLCSSYCFFLE
jgi:hypothetical protein